jgi:hypothetical protein
LPWSPAVPFVGFGYPFNGVSYLSPEGLFQPPTLMGFALQSFTPFLGSIQSFLCIFRSCAFSENLSAFCRRFSGFFPHEQPCLLAPRRVRSEWDPCFLGLCSPRRFSRRKSRKEASPFSSLPPVLWLDEPYDSSLPGPQGLSYFRRGISLRKGRPPV